MSPSMPVDTTTSKSITDSSLKGSTTDSLIADFNINVEDTTNTELKYYWKADSTYTASGNFTNIKSKKVYKFPYSDTDYVYFINRKFKRHKDSLIEVKSKHKTTRIILRRYSSNR